MDPDLYFPLYDFVGLRISY